VCEEEVLVERPGQLKPQTLKHIRLQGHCNRDGVYQGGCTRTHSTAAVVRVRLCLNANDQKSQEQSTLLLHGCNFAALHSTSITL
jgi:hypothetical protein